MLAKLVTRTVVLLTLAAPAHADPDWRAVAQALGKSGAEMPGGGTDRARLTPCLDSSRTGSDVSVLLSCRSSEARC